MEVETRLGNLAAQRAAIAVGFEPLDEARMTVAGGEPRGAARLSLESWRDRWEHEPI